MPTPSSPLFEEVRYVSTEELERRFFYRSATWRKWCMKGKLKGARRLMGRWMVPLHEVQLMLEAEKAAHPEWTPVGDRGKPIGGVKENSR